MNEFRPKENYLVSIDGLRALSIILVVLFHCSLFTGEFLIGKVLGTFDIGVNCFFVISGFLITRILLKTKNEENYYYNFFFRRVLRIFPLYYLILFIAFVILPQFDHPKLAKWSEVEPLWYWLFLSNFYIAFREKFSHGLVDLSWSLSIEEQFYLVWPWIVYFVRNMRLSWVCLGGIALSIGIRSFLFLNEYTHYYIHLFTFCQFDGLLMGSLLALESQKILGFMGKGNRRFYAMAFGFGLFYLSALGGNKFFDFLNASLGYTFVAFMFCGLLAHLYQEKEGLFAHPVLVSIGKYSYGIYLTHNIIQGAMRKYIWGDVSKIDPSVQAFFFQILFALTVLLLSYIVSYISFHAYEKHFLKLKKYFKN